MPGRWLLATCLALALAAWPDRVAAEPIPAEAKPSLYRRFKVSLGYHYSVGDYGESESTAIQYVPLVLTADLDRWRIQATVPYLNIDGPGGLIPTQGGLVESIDGDASGLGDVWLRGSWLLPVERLLPDDLAASAWLPYIDLAGLVKFPTGSRSEGLGTGEFDFGVDTELTWAIGDVVPFATLGYRCLGSPPPEKPTPEDPTPPDTTLSDVFVASLGGLYRLAPTLSAGALLDYRTSPSPDVGQRLELVPYAAWLIAAGWSLEGYVSAGLADGSPDFGVGLQCGYSW